MDIAIVEFKETPVAVLEHQGSKEGLNDTVAKFIQWRQSTDYSPIATSHTFGVPYGDPGTVAPEEFRFDICGSVSEKVPENAFGVINKVIPGGRCVRLRHEGSHEEMDMLIKMFYREWLPKSGETLRDFPLYFHYVTVGTEADENKQVTDILIPIV